MVRLHSLDESSIEFIVRPWVATQAYWEVYWDVTREVKKRFDAAGISIPVPHRDIRVRQDQ
jgi:small conductance mechanosensitive channel